MFFIFPSSFSNITPFAVQVFMFLRYVYSDFLLKTLQTLIWTLLIMPDILRSHLADKLKRRHQGKMEQLKTWPVQPVPDTAPWPLSSCFCIFVAMPALWFPFKNMFVFFFFPDPVQSNVLELCLECKLFVWQRTFLNFFPPKCELNWSSSPAFF